ncbi:glutamine synthetase [Anaplasma centrale str. Israel]|uniref:Glutamine synthetase n=1 Tax=Anaplasma centrale (strain Israel) TaxID=574556 RepID=D1ATJ7_ANACI|nr:type I glutamate--ammonia ligase [Anaplasma centrale]ACZ48875.1 glutamine synthetase [Anaplasma centrale str. Israel]
MFSRAEDLMDYVAKNAIKFIDWRFTDLLGRWHHTTYSVSALDAAVFSYGIAFDGSSIPGWQPVGESDMLLVPDVSTAFVEPFSPHPSLAVICNVVSPHGHCDYMLDPRYTARKAHEYMLASKIADKCFFGPELEFFVFDHVRFGTDPCHTYFKLACQEGGGFGNRELYSSDRGYKIRAKDGYCRLAPVDSLQDMRSEMLVMLSEVGVTPLLHYHEVAVSQCEIGFKYAELVTSADSVQKCKYVLRNVAHSYGKSVTFMPKPVHGDNGSGMHCHQSLWKGGDNMFSGNNSGLSELCLYYIGGIIRHGRALSAFANPSTNSYKRLLPGFEAPTWLVYSHENRSAAVRIPCAPSSGNSAAVRIEVRFPDPLANPYLCFAAQLMAGLDGIKHKMHPLEVGSKCLYSMDESETRDFLPVPASLDEAIESLDKDRDFLLEGGVFTNEQVESYIQLKKLETNSLRSYPHPVEFSNYYSL